MKCNDVFSAWGSIQSLATKAIIPSIRGRYAISRAYDKLLPTIKRLEEERNKIIKEYCNLDEKTQISTGLKEGKNQAEFDQKFKEFTEMDIEVDIYKIHLSDLNDVKFPREQGDDVPLPAIHLSWLKDFIIEEDEVKKLEVVK
jgi:hypothetical protein